MCGGGGGHAFVPRHYASLYVAAAISYVSGNYSITKQIHKSIN